MGSCESQIKNLESDMLFAYVEQMTHSTFMYKNNVNKKITHLWERNCQLKFQIEQTKE